MGEYSISDGGLSDGYFSEPEVELDDDRDDHDQECDSRRDDGVDFQDDLEDKDGD